jgi:DNA-binding beta-propeller fold protein YncE
MPGVKPGPSGIAVSRDGSTLLVSDLYGGSHAIHEFRVADGSPLRVIGTDGTGPLQFQYPRQVWIAPDDYAFVADTYNNRVQVLTPGRDFHGFVGVGRLNEPWGVCANADVVVVSGGAVDGEPVVVFKRSDDTILHRFGSRGYEKLLGGGGLCFAVKDRHLAVVDSHGGRVVVVTLAGVFKAAVGVGELSHPSAVMTSSTGELVIADSGNRRLALFSARARFVKDIVKDCPVHGAVMHGGVLFVLGEGKVSLLR